MVHTMTESKESGGEGWLWVVVSDKDTDGRRRRNRRRKREKGKKYEVQAVHIEELSKDAEKAGFGVAIVDGDGKIVK